MPAMAMSKLGQIRPPPKPSTLNKNVGSKSLSIGDVHQILVAFTHGLSQKTLPWTEYCQQLGALDPVGLKRFCVLRDTVNRRIEFIERQVSGFKNSVKVELSGGIPILSISDCSCCGRCPQVPASSAPPSKEEDEEAFSSALGRFNEMRLPLNDWIEVSVTKVDPLPRKLRIQFSWRTHHHFDILHERLMAAYRNNSVPIVDLKVGTVCALPFESTRDYHRGIVKDMSNPSLPVVYYVDLGVEIEVTRECIRKLHEKFYEYPTFCLSGEVRNSPLFRERMHLAEKLSKKERVLLKAEKYDKLKNRYLMVLDTDSGIASDSSQ